MGGFVIGPALRALLEKLKDPLFEDCIPYMYVDSVAKVTVGVGHNLTAHKDHQQLPFIVKRFTRHSVLGGDTGTAITANKAPGRKASATEIQHDFDFLTRHTGLGKFHAAQLAKYTTVELEKTDIDDLFATDCDEAARIVEQTFPRVATFPVTCQAAIMDIAFNVGNFASFKHTFVPAVNGTGAFAKTAVADRWRAAAAHSRRGKVDASRNKQIADWLMAGATAQGAIAARAVHAFA